MDDEEDDNTRECDSCETVFDEDQMSFDDNGVCEDCQEAAEADRQMRSDYYFWAR